MLVVKKIFLESILKSMEKNEEFESIKSEVISILKKQLKDGKKEIEKALYNMEKNAKFLTKPFNEIVIKSGYPVGTIREWKGQKFIKIAPNKWKPKYDSETKGAKNALTRLIHQVEKCESPEELMKIVMANKQRFTDANGNHLPIVDKIRAAVDRKNESFDKQTQTPKTEKENKEESRFASKNDLPKEEKDKNLQKLRDSDVKMIERNKALIKKYNSKIEEDERGLDFPKDMSNEDKIEWIKNKIQLLKNQIEYNDYESWTLAHKESAEKIFRKNTKEINQYEEDIKFYESEAEKHANRSEGMKGNQQPLDVVKQPTANVQNVIAPNQNISSESSSVKPTKTISDIRNKYESSKSVIGNSKSYRLPDGSKIKCHYKLVEADAPTASHDETTYQPNEALMKNGSTINDRDYSKDKDAQESVRKIASNYNGLALQDMPIVTKDGVVISGNNRTMSSKLAAKQGTDTEYINDLKDEISDYGIDEAELKKFKHPRLVLEMDEEHKGEYTTEEYAKFNKDTKKTKNTVEKAVEISKTVKPMAISNLAETLSSYDTMGDLYNNKKAAMEFAEKLVTNGIIQKNELSQYYTEESGFSESGKEFVETVLTGSVLNEENLRSIAGAGGKSIRRKLVRAILPLIDNKGMGNEYSFNNEFNNAVKIAVTVNKNHETYPDVNTYLKQDDMFTGKTDELTGKLAEIIHDYGEKNFSDKLKELNAGLRPSANGEFDMFLGRCETRNEILDRLLSIKSAVKKALESIFLLTA